MTGPHTETERKVFELLRLIDEFVLREKCSVREACQRLGVKHYSYFKAKKWLKTGKWNK
jgi:hypothetical protein